MSKLNYGSLEMEKGQGKPPLIQNSYGIINNQN